MLRLKLRLFQMLYGERKMRFVLAMLLMSPLMACSSLTGTSATNGAACEVWKDVSWSSKDTPQTITEIKVNNARRDGYCGVPSSRLSWSIGN